MPLLKGSDASAGALSRRVSGNAKLPRRCSRLGGCDRFCKETANWRHSARAANPTHAAVKEGLDGLDHGLGPVLAALAHVLAIRNVQPPHLRRVTWGESGFESWRTWVIRNYFFLFAAIQFCNEQPQVQAEPDCGAGSVRREISTRRLE